MCPGFAVDHGEMCVALAFIYGWCVTSEGCVGLSPYTVESVVNSGWW